MQEKTGPLAGIRVLDLTRVLAGPTCTQMLGDLGAEIIKIERPEAGDDTRGFAPPFIPNTRESAYFVGVNRNKKSVTVDIGKPEGQALILKLLEHCDILAENFKVGALAKYGLGWEQLSAKFPKLIYCSITGFGQTGPYAPRPGYDALIQAMGGVMSLTGEPKGSPQKVGVPVADLFAGLGTFAFALAGRYRVLAVEAARDAHLACKAAAARAVIDQVLAGGPPQGHWLLNVNIPNRADAARLPRVVTRLGRRHASEPVVTQTSPRGDTLYWIGPAGDAREAGAGTDFHAVASGAVSITPLQVDLTDHASRGGWAERLGVALG